MENRKVECDKCKADLTETSNITGWRLALGPEAVPCRGGWTTAMMTYPALDRTHHFCGMNCLKGWLDDSTRHGE